MADEMRCLSCPIAPNDKLILSCALWKMNARAGGKQAVIKIWRKAKEDDE